MKTLRHSVAQVKNGFLKTRMPTPLRLNTMLTLSMRFPGRSISVSSTVHVTYHATLMLRSSFELPAPPDTLRLKAHSPLSLPSVAHRRCQADLYSVRLVSAKSGYLGCPIGLGSHRSLLLASPWGSILARPDTQRKRLSAKCRNGR